MKRTTLTVTALLLLGAITPAFAADVAENWKEHCARCHGLDGKAETRLGRRLKLEDYTDPAVQAKFTDEEAEKLILEGLKDDNGKELMKSYAGDLTPEEITEIIAYIRAMAS